MCIKIVASNRRARFDLNITETVEAGIVLTGAEVKSCRLGQVNLAGAYVSMLHGKLIIKSMKISPYKYASNPSYEPARERELLVKKSERDRLEQAVEQKGMTVVPLEVHSGRFIKLLLGIGTGRKKLDKRQRIREREVERRMRRGDE